MDIKANKNTQETDTEPLPQANMQSIPKPKPHSVNFIRFSGKAKTSEIHSEEFLGHVCTTSLVDDVRNGEHDLECDYQKDEETHARGRGGDS